MIEYEYKVGDLVSYCDRPAIITTTDGTFADILLLDDYITTVVLLDKVNYLAPGQQYLREAHTMACAYLLVERLGALNKEKNNEKNNEKHN